ncbi:large conductance mechanosensitive channel protein MscL [Lichenihabitans sp. Uapishka_5]|uniref:large conductance mechanosensitive channel protein MscL n=1 Tax=Lichenihabitans sp. Uapishka_5 TaxID=3037302 RepID=UPI0029E81993|nr:large conductance mechanosensitive channel protein MscL [Lichenihabitans sp. Uapishka_5]MDX7950207.1 large conductance mechanosensitive channel protein MscL [Lichenihabitans sp. Uapishka_5]
MTIRAPKLSLREELKQFRSFALKGNVIDLAFAVIIGAAFSKIVDSLVKDIIMPIIGLVGSADFSNYFLPLSHNVTANNLADAQKQGAVLAWGSFATYVVNFMIVAFVLFLIVKAIRRFQTEAPKLDPIPTGEEKLLVEIRDILARSTPIR